MATLTGQAAEDYIKSGKSYKLISGDPSKKYKGLGGGGLIPSLFRAILLKPFAQISGGVNRLGTSFGNRIAGPGGQITDVPLLDRWLSEDEQRDIIEDPTKSVAKGGASLAAYATPAMLARLGLAGNVSKTAGVLAKAKDVGKVSFLAGALQSYGGSRSGKELSDTLLGGALGFGLGYGTSLAGGLLGELGGKLGKSGASNKLASLSDDLSRKAFIKRMGMNPTPSELGEGILNDIDRIGLNRAQSADELFSGATQIIKSRGPVVGETLNALTAAGKLKPVPREKLFDAVKGMLTDPAITPRQKQAVQGVLDDIMGTFGGPTRKTIQPSELYKLKQNIGTLRYASKMNNKLVSAKAYDALYARANQLLNNSLKGAGFTEYIPINKEITAAYNVLPYAGRASGKVDMRQIGSLGDIATFIAGGAPAATGRALLNTSTGLDWLSKVAGAGSRATQGLGTAGGSLNNVLGGLGQTGLKRGIIGGTIPRFLTGPDSSLAPVPIDASALEQLPQQTASQPVPFMLAYQLAYRVAPKSSESEALRFANAIIDNYVLQQGQLVPKAAVTSAKMTQRQQAMDVVGRLADEALGMLDEGGVNTGLIGGRFESLLQPIGLGGRADTKYRAKIANARTLLRSSLLGAAMSPQELESLAASIPEYNDPLEVQKIKLEGFRQLAEKYKGGDVKVGLEAGQ